MTTSLFNAAVFPTLGVIHMLFPLVLREAELATVKHSAILCADAHGRCFGRTSNFPGCSMSCNRSATR